MADKLISTHEKHLLPYKNYARSLRYKHSGERNRRNSNSYNTMGYLPSRMQQTIAGRSQDKLAVSDKGAAESRAIWGLGF